MVEKETRRPEELKRAHDTLLKIGATTVELAGVKRVTRYTNGEFENDAEHSLHLLRSALYLVEKFYPHLDRNLITHFCIVHDMVEIYAGDTPSFKLTDEERSEKEAREKASLERLLVELDPETADYLSRYEKQEEPEARFVRLVDKLCPSIIHAVAPDANRGGIGADSRESVEEDRATRRERLLMEYPEFSFIASDLRVSLAETSDERLFGPIQ
jgi:5'-deoxynucleotidase YfbR-like HD superfamily hydrolase